MANHRSRTISRIDPQTNTEIATITPAIPEGFNLGPVAVGPHGVWYAFAGNPDSKQLLFHINPATNGVDQVLPVKGITTILDSDAGLWGLVQGSTRNSLVQLSADGKTLKTVDLGPPPTTGSSSPFYAFASLWVAVDDKKLARIDPVGGVITAVVSTPATILGWRTMTADSTHAFLTLYDLSVVRIDPTNNCVDAQLFFGSNIGLINPLNGRISVLSTPKGLYVGFARGALALVDPATMTVRKSVRLDEQDLVGLPGFGFGSVWYPTFSENSVLRVKPLG